MGVSSGRGYLQLFGSVRLFSVCKTSIGAATLRTRSCPRVLWSSHDAVGVHSPGADRRRRLARPALLRHLRPELVRRAAGHGLRVPRDGLVRMLRAVRRRRGRAVRSARFLGDAVRARFRVRETPAEQENGEEEVRAGCVHVQKRRLPGVWLGQCGVPERVRAESSQWVRGASKQTGH